MAQLVWDCSISIPNAWRCYSLTIIHQVMLNCNTNTVFDTAMNKAENRIDSECIKDTSGELWGAYNIWEKIDLVMMSANYKMTEMLIRFSHHANNQNWLGYNYREDKGQSNNSTIAGCICRMLASSVCNGLTHKGLETHGCVISTVATAALVLKHQAISNHSPH